MKQDHDPSLGHCLLHFIDLLYHMQFHEVTLELTPDHDIHPREALKNTSERKALQLFVSHQTGFTRKRGVYS
jgi:hypothetical protein